MKIHMDYLEGKVEEFDHMRSRWEGERRSFAKRLQIVEEKVRKEAEAEVTRMKEECKRQIE
jgi:hypothetical protein